MTIRSRVVFPATDSEREWMSATRTIARLTYTVTALLAIASAAATAQKRPREFARGIAGSYPPSAADRPQTWFDKPVVRRLLAELEGGPLPTQKAEQLLAGSDVALADLKRLKLVAERDGHLSIGFSYFTRGDMQRIHATADRYVPQLVAAYEERTRDFDRHFARYDVPSVERKQLAFVLLAGVALNWDALKQTELGGYREPQLVTGKGWQYSFWAAEADPDYSIRGFFWGSSTAPVAIRNLTFPVDFSFSSFGDPYSDPRMNLPDVLVLPVAKITPDVREAVEDIGVIDESEFGFEFKDVLGFARGRELASILFGLRRGPKQLADIEPLLSPELRGQARELLRVLKVIDYVRERPDGRYELVVPVLDYQDGQLVADVLALHRRILQRWLDAHYASLRSELSDLTVIRQGVPFEAIFTQIWHDFFGLTTRELVRKGVIADPYADSLDHRGSFGLVWRHSVYDFSPH